MEKRSWNKRLLLITLAVVAVVAVAVAVAVAVVFINANSDDEGSEMPVVNGDFAIKMSLNETWMSDYGDKTSEKWKILAEDIETNMGMAFNESFLLNIVNSSSVVRLSKGSVVCEMVMMVNQLYYTISDQGNNVVKVNLESNDVSNAIEHGVKVVVNKNPYSILAKVDITSVHVEKTSEKEEAVKEECVSKTDVVFLMDESGSIGAPNFITLKHFVSEFAASSDINNETIQISVIAFSGDVRLLFHLKQYQSAGSVVSAINAINYHGGSTNIAKGLQYVKDSAYTEDNGGRSDASKLLILMTDGQSSDASSEARQLKDTGVVIICIGIGSGINMNQLNAIASQESMVLLADSFDALAIIKNVTLKASCETNFTCYGDIQKLNPTGKTSGGIAASQTDAEYDVTDIMKRRSCYMSAGRANCIHPALIAAIGSRESRAGRLLENTDGWGDKNNAYGILQCDINANPVANYDLTCRSYPWDSCEHIRMMTSYVIVPYIKAVQKKHPDWTIDQQLQGGVAAYNFGVGNVQSWKHLDQGTTGDDYSNDVVARAKYLIKHFEEDWQTTQK